MAGSGRSPGAVVFDLFHTLVNPEEFRPPDFVRLERIAAVFGVDAAQLADHWEREVVSVVARSPLRPVDLLAEHASANGSRPDDAQIAAADDALGRYQDAALLQPLAAGVRALAGARARGLAVGLLSNAHERDVREWPRSPLAAHCDAAVFSCFAGVAKPEPAAYAAILDALGADAADAVYAGDGGTDELRGAREAGFGLVVCVQGPALRHGFRSPAEMDALAADADAVVTGADEVLGLV